MANTFIPEKLLTIHGRKVNLTKLISSQVETAIATEEADGLSFPLIIEGDTAFNVALGSYTNIDSYTAAGLSATNSEVIANIGIYTTDEFPVLELAAYNTSDRNVVNLDATSFSILQSVDSDASTLNFTLNAEGTAGLTLTGDAAFKITDSRSITTGIIYNADYSAEFTERSLVDKGYTDLAYQPKLTTGTAAPITTPEAVGLFYLDVDNSILYVSIATEGAASWKAVTLN